MILRAEKLARAMGETIRIVRILDAANQTMRYNVLLRLVGAIPEEVVWKGNVSQRLAGDLLNAAAEFAEKNGELIARERGEAGLGFWRIVNATGKPGKGIAKLKVVAFPDPPTEKDFARSE